MLFLLLFCILKIIFWDRYISCKFYFCLRNFFWKEQRYTKNVGLVVGQKTQGLFQLTLQLNVLQLQYTVREFKKDLCYFTAGTFWCEIFLISQSSLLL